jgi:hypothetical protein
MAALAMGTTTTGLVSVAVTVASIRSRFCHSNRRRTGALPRLATPFRATDQVRTLVSLSGVTCPKRAINRQFGTFAYATSKHRFPLRDGAAPLPVVNIPILVTNCVPLPGKLSPRNRYYLLRRTVG